MLILDRVDCPYCGEHFDTEIDLSAGNQDYIEDCQVCCRPIVFRIAVDDGYQLNHVKLLREDD